MTTLRTKIAWLNMAMMLIILSAYATIRYSQPPAPAPINSTSITEAEIKKEVKIEQHARALKKATAAARMVYRKNHVSEKYSEFTAKAALDYGISPRLLAGLVVIESHGNPRATDHLGSYGLTQVNSKVWGNRRVSPLYDPETNLRIGASILAGYTSRFGLVEGLHHYNGYSEVHGHIYVNKVLTAAGFAVSIPRG